MASVVGRELAQFMNAVVTALGLAEQDAKAQHVAHLGQQGPRVFLFFARHLGAVLSQVNVVLTREKAARVPGIPKPRVEQHQGRLEDVEKDLVAQERAEPPQDLYVVELNLDVSRMLDQPIDASDENQRHARVQDEEYGPDSVGADAGTDEADVEEGGQ